MTLEGISRWLESSSEQGGRKRASLPPRSKDSLQLNEPIRVLPDDAQQSFISLHSPKHM